MVGPNESRLVSSIWEDALVASTDDLPLTRAESADAWHAWLRRHHASAPGTWLMIARKASGLASVTRVEAVKEALCWGWIDGQGAKHDDDFSLIRFTPRRARSKWSQVNVGYVAELEAAGRMQPAGIAQVEAAKADGRWDAAYSPPSSKVLPPELEVAFERDPAARAAFDALSSANRFAVRYRIENSKRPETKARHVAKTLEMLARGETYH
ncbi:MAG: hypothetical protein JWM86_1756 [Thermoleophilia bacterium]|nr:hypothetical protein [Thermoleophilia bacterium]